MEAMETPHIATNFPFPNQRPSTPPVTPNSSRSRYPYGGSYASVASMGRRNRNAFGMSPPENIAPRGPGHAFSYTPPDKDDDDDDEPSDSDSDPADTESNASDENEEKSPVPEPDSESEAEIERKPPRLSVTRAIDEDTDFTIEEISEDDIAWDETEVILPFHTEEARSENGSDILDALKRLHCGGEEERERAFKFETAQRRRYQRRSKRWSIGGYKKRSHAQSVGSQSSGHEDIDFIEEDIHLPGASARRLRRRTQGPDDIERPSRTSLLFEDPPKEFEELAVIDEPAPPDTEYYFDHFDLWSDNDSDDEVEEIELLLPNWLMDLEADHSRPSTPLSTASQMAAATPS